MALAASLVAARADAVQAKQLQPSTRKVKVSTPPEYPELARKMNIQGLARVLLTVAPGGKVTAVKELGGNPVLVAALVEAVKKWKYEPADRETTIEVRFEFR
jgi:TonB family protein